MAYTDQDRIAYWKGRNHIVFPDLYRFKIEASLGCNRKCGFCGMTRNEEHLMTMDTFKALMAQFPDTIKRIEFILHGEPTLNPLLPEFVSMVRERSARTQIAIATNGYRFVDKQIDPDYLFGLYEAGANVIQLSIYDERVRDNFIELGRSNLERFGAMGVKLKDFYTTKDVLFRYKGLKREFTWVDETELNRGESLQRRFHTFGGNIPERHWKKYSNLDLSSFPMVGKGKTCTSLLKYMPIGAKGDIYFCCRDAAHSTSLGNVFDTDLNEFWHSKTIQAIRYTLKSARRDLVAPCFLCSRFCYRDALYAYWGPDFTKEECIEEIHKFTDLKDEPLLRNLIAYQEGDYGEMPEHILEEIKYSKNKFGR